MSTQSLSPLRSAAIRTDKARRAGMPGPEKHGHPVLRRMGAALAGLGCLVVMAGSVAGVALAAYLRYLSENDLPVLDLYALEVAENSIVYAQDPGTGLWVEYDTFTGDTNRIWTPIEQMPQSLRDAVVSVEDRGFWDQPFGINPARILGAAINELTDYSLYGNRQGASSLEQQVVQNLTGDPAQSIPGKFREICRAIVMAGTYSKEAVLEAYLNIAPMTGTMSGMQMGALTYFGKEVSDLTLAESATLASIPRSPVAYNPYTNADALLERRNWVLQLMLDQGRISQSAYDEAAAAPLGVLPQGSVNLTADTDGINSYFTDALYEQVVRDLMAEQGISQEEAAYQLTSGGLRIYATVDLDLQGTLETMMEDDSEDGYFPALWRYEAVATDIPYGGNIDYNDAGLPLNRDGSAVFASGDTPAYNSDGSLRTGQGTDGMVEFYRALRTQAAAVTIDYEGHVRALVGGIGEKAVDLAYNRATAPHQTGSTMKPLASYALGIEYGFINYSTPMVDAPLYMAADKRVLNTDLVQRLGLPNDPFAAVNLARDDVWRSWPNNYSGTPSGNTVLVASALAQSLNTIPVQLGNWIGTDDMLNFLQDWLGISTLDPENDNALAPLVLGSQTNGISPLELAAAYAIFNEGIYTPPTLYTQVLDRDGYVVLDRQEQSFVQQAISPETATIMNHLLQGVLTASNGTARGMAPEGDLPAAAKTGTTTDYRDFTFVGLTPYYITAGWWGFDDPTDMSDLGVTSGRPLQILWRDYMTQVQQDLPYRDFAQAEGVVQRRYDPATGRMVSSGGAIGYYTLDNLPVG